MSFDNLLVDREPRLAILTIQRPQRLNALDARTLDELRDAFLSFRNARHRISAQKRKPEFKRRESRDSGFGTRDWGFD